MSAQPGRLIINGLDISAKFSKSTQSQSEMRTSQPSSKRNSGVQVSAGYGYAKPVPDEMEAPHLWRTNLKATNDDKIAIPARSSIAEKRKTLMGVFEPAKQDSVTENTPSAQSNSKGYSDRRGRLANALQTNSLSTDNSVVTKKKEDRLSVVDRKKSTDSQSITSLSSQDLLSRDETPQSQSLKDDLNAFLKKSTEKMSKVNELPFQEVKDQRRLSNSATSVRSKKSSESLSNGDFGAAGKIHRKSRDSLKPSFSEVESKFEKQLQHKDEKISLLEAELDEKSRESAKQTAAIESLQQEVTHLKQLLETAQGFNEVTNQARVLNTMTKGRPLRPGNRPKPASQRPENSAVTLDRQHLSEKAESKNEKIDEKQPSETKGDGAALSLADKFKKFGVSSLGRFSRNRNHQEDNKLASSGQAGNTSSNTSATRRISVFGGFRAPQR